MILYMFIFTLFLAILSIYVCLMNSDLVGAVGFALAFIMFNFVLVPIFIEPHPHVVEAYNIPYCPEDNFKTYQIEVDFFSNETDIINEFNNHGWNNLTTMYISDGAFFFGGTDKFIQGECDLNAMAN